MTGKNEKKLVVAPINSSCGYSIEINPQTKFIFSPSGSPSSIIDKNDTLKKIGFNLAYFTFPHAVTAKEYVGLLKSPIARGGAVTGQGLKSDIIPLLDCIDPLAQSMNSVNTVVNSNGQLSGYNTDATGFETAIKNGISGSGVEIKTAVVYGNGGVSGTAVKVLQSMGITVALTGRNSNRVSKKRNELNLSSREGPFDLVVNATPVSQFSIDDVIGLPNLLKDCTMVFDHNMPEKDGKKNYLKLYCGAKDIPFIPGKEMYIPQLIAQWGLFFDGLIKEDGTPWITESEITDLVNRNTG
ncbi:MAG: shikimate dehydrogenase [SAR324 cluster bacterium]|nr:shikimate dehydrogenase [SAR324 cluster bacterium]